MPMPRLSLSIRHKVLVALTACLLAVGFMAALSLSRLSGIEDKLTVVEMAGDLSETILEARRYEKNYLLYVLPEDLAEARKYAEKAVALSEAIESKSVSLSALSLIRELRREIKVYLVALSDLSELSGRVPVDPQIEERLRGEGKDLVERALGLVQFERGRIGEIIGSLRAQLLFAVGAFLVMATALMLLVRGKIIRPLAAIEQATRRIAQGEFSTLETKARRDETGRVIEAFNTMVSELEKRQDQLVQAKKLSSIGTLAAGIAHQLNNPLNNISTSCQIAVEEFDAGDRELLLKMLGNIDKETLRARDIVRGLLEFSRDKQFALSETNLGELMRGALRLASSQVPPGIEASVEVPEDLSADLDKQKMQEVFINMIINAVQAIKSGRGMIRLAAKAVDDPMVFPAPCVEITVADSGEGIPEDQIGSIFDPFFTTKDVGAGTGLGLSIVYGIIKKHEGQVEVQSRPGQGATFTIRLPRSSRSGAAEGGR
jgi:two-component system, NtrC family, sensor kinase